MCFPLLANSDAINKLQGEPEKNNRSRFLEPTIASDTIGTSDLS